MIWNWLMIHVGVRDVSGPWYAFWSGFGSDLGEATIFWAMVVAYRHKNCHVKGCWHLGHIDPKNSHPACRKHHSQIGAE